MSGRRWRRAFRPGGRPTGSAWPSSPSDAWRQACTARGCSRTRRAQPSVSGRRPGGRWGEQSHASLEAVGDGFEVLAGRPSTRLSHPRPWRARRLGRRRSRRSAERWPCCGRCPATTDVARRAALALFGARDRDVVGIDALRQVPEPVLAVAPRDSDLAPLCSQLSIMITLRLLFQPDDFQGTTAESGISAPAAGPRGEAAPRSPAESSR